MSRGGKGAPSPKSVRPGDVFGVQFVNPSKRAYRVENNPPLEVAMTPLASDDDGLVDGSAPISAAWEFFSTVMPRAASGKMKDQAAKVDAAAQKAVRRAKLEGVVRELERPAYEFTKAVSQVFADNPCWRADLALAPGERLVCAFCFSKLSGPLQEVSVGPRALTAAIDPTAAAPPPRQVVADAPAAAGAAKSGARRQQAPVATAVVAMVAGVAALAVVVV